MKTTVARLRDETIARTMRKRKTRMMFTVFKAMVHSDLRYRHDIRIHTLGYSPCSYFHY